MPHNEDPLSSAMWMLDNARRTLIPNFDALDATKIAEGCKPGVYTLVGANDSRAFLKVDRDGTATKWDLDYDPEYLCRGTDLRYLGKIVVDGPPIPPKEP